MPITRPYGLDSVADEFNQLYVVRRARWIAEAIFGSAPGVRLSDYEGLGQPTVTRTGSSSTNSSFTVNFNVATNGSTTLVRIEYHPASNPAALSNTGFVTKGNGSHSIEVTGLNGNTEYSYRIQHYNSFGTATYYLQTVAYSATTLNPVLNAPALTSISWNVMTDYTVLWNISGEIPTSLIFEYQINGGAWNTNVATANFNNSSAPYSVEITPNAIPNPGELFTFRARAVKTGFSTSGYSNTISYQW